MAAKRKITARNLFDCENLDNFVASIIQILPYKGFSMSRFYLCELSGVQFLTKLCFYRKTAPEIYGTVPPNVMPHIDAEINILRILNEKFIKTNVTPCLIEIVYSKICEDLNKLVPKDQSCDQLILYEGDMLPEDDIGQLMCRYRDLTKNGLAHNKCAFIVLDKCDISFDEYLQKSITTPISLAVFKSLLFMIIYTLYAICWRYPNFRHFDLHTENIMLKFDPRYAFKAADPKFLVFFIEGVQYTVPYFGIFPKIIDFGFSSLPEENVMSNATVDKERMYIRAQNDLLLLFHWIHFRLGQISSNKLGWVDKILRQLEPNGTYIHYYTEYIRKNERKIPSYKQMIKNSVWNEYKTTVPQSQVHATYTALEDLNI